MGIVPAGTKLTARPAEIPAWDSLSADQKRLFARQMETFAGFAEHTDHEVGRLVSAIEDMGELDNTLFFYIVGDNGSSAEGGPDGTYNEILALNGIVSDVSSQLAHIDEWGGPNTFPHFSIGWAHAGNTPFQWTKQVASHFGGTRNAMVVHWPERIPDAKGEVRSQFHHVIDVAPTVLEAAGLPQPTMVNGTKQYPMDGVSMVYTFDDAGAPDRRTTQYFEMFGNRAIYHDGWVAATRHSIPWLMVPLPPLDQDHWELYHVAEDFSQADRSRGGESREAQRAAGAVHAGSDPKPRLSAGRSPVGALRRRHRWSSGSDGAAHVADPLRRNDRHRRERVHQHQGTVERDHRRDRRAGEGERGHHRPGRTLRRLEPVHEGRARCTTSTTTAVSSAPRSRRRPLSRPALTRCSTSSFTTAGSPGSGGLSRLTIDGEPAGEVRVPRTMPFVYSADEGIDVGVDNETPVTEDYAGASEFTGRIVKVTVEAK